MTKTEAINKLVATARGELGNREGGNNYTKYAADPDITKLYGWTPQNQPWCCTFVNWCFMHCFGFDIGSRLTYGGSAACANSASLFRAHNALFMFPELGDQAFYYSGGGINHTGLVVEVSGGSFIAIEGNYSDKVSSVTHRISGSDIAGFGRPDWSLVQSVASTGDDKPVSAEKQPSVSLEDHALHLTTLSYNNSYNNSVVLLQAVLNLRHWPCGTVDGFFGPKTQSAVNRAREYFGMEQNGKCDMTLWSKLMT